ncbi:MAG: ABC transporter substrate-binding protein [Deltaproteobacteria bacterium]|nr:ABC transporter substrate-binding protein [Deltaproteobacteria bacterium]
MKLKRLFLLITALSLILGLSSSTFGAEQPEPVRIGVYLPMTGPLATQGQAEYTGIEIAHGMRPTVLGREVELILVDTAQGGTGAAEAVTRLINEKKVHALIGEPVETDAFGGLSIAENAGKPTVVPVTPSTGKQGRRYAFHVGLSTALQAEAAARFAPSHLKAKKAALLMNIERDHSIDLANIFVRTVTQTGGRVVMIAYCRTGDRNFSTQLSSIMAAKPDVLYLPLSYPEIVRICRQSEDMGINTPIISSVGAHTPEFITAGGNSVEGVMVTSDFSKEVVSSDIATAYLDAHEKGTGTPAVRFNVLGADAYLLLIDAIERTRSTAGTKIRQALAATKRFNGISGVMDMDRGGNAVKGVLMLRVKGEEFRYLGTLSPGQGPES